MKRPAALCPILAVFVLAALSSLAQQRRPVSARDCVMVRDLAHDDATFRSTIKISPDGSRVAYSVKSANLQTNENEVELYVRKLPIEPDHSAKPLIVGDISAVRWLADSRHLTMFVEEGGHRVIEQVDCVTSEHDVLVQVDSDISEYGISADGSTVVYATAQLLAGEGGRPTAQDIASGYPVSFQKAVSTLRPSERLFATKRLKNGWSTAEPITITSPLNLQPLTELIYGNVPDLNPTVSPDGKNLLLTYWDFSQDMPDEWRTSGYMQFRNSNSVGRQAFHVLVLFDLASGKTTVPLKTPAVMYAPLWSSDGKSFAAMAEPPVGSELEQENVKNHIIGHSAAAHLFRVDLRTGQVDDVASKLVYPWEGPLFWDNNGDFVLRTKSMETISRYSRGVSGWQEVSSWKIPLQLGPQVATDWSYIIADFSDTTTPPQLFICDRDAKQVQVFAKLNPQFDDLVLGEPREIHWKTSGGFDATGLLLLPPTYEKGRRYPLVIQTKPFSTSFVCSFGKFPSFAPQPITAAGMMYLGQIPTQGSAQREQDYYPKGYSGHQAEAAFAMDLWDSAIKTLDGQGLIDSKRIGIIGFSRTGWYTEFILTHSKLQYRAATVADNVQYSIGEYWLLHDASTIKAYDSMYGGPPYGPTLNNWLDGSVSFNLDKFHTPLLMEQMGYNRLYDKPSAPPINVAVAFEVFTGLNRLNKPVELYYYPLEDHEPDHPQARLASMQRNVDWYRFWLKDEEDTSPAKTEQYKRWRELRKLQQKNDDRGEFGGPRVPGPRW